MSLRTRRPAHRMALVLLALLPGWLVLAAGPALAQPLGCGAVVTQSVTLAADLLDCPGDGLVIGAGGITVDLNGRTISGEIIPGSPGQVGIDNSGGFDDVTIRNGTIRDFHRGGVHLVRADRNQIQDLTMDFFSEFGILLEGGGSANRFTGNRLDRPGQVGIGIFGAARASRDNLITGNLVNDVGTASIALRFGRITGTLIEDNTVTGGDNQEQWGGGIVVSRGDADILRTIVRGNRLEENYGPSIFVGGSAQDTVVQRNAVDDAFGVGIESNGARTLVRGNTVTSTLWLASTFFAIQVDRGGEDTRVELNRIERPGFIGIDDSGTRTVMTGNTILGQLNPGDPFTGLIAGIIVREEASDGRIQANVVRRLAPSWLADTGAGIHVFGDRFSVVANVVSEMSAADGIRVEPQAMRTLLKANIAPSNGDDGIDVDSPATTVTANVANDNADLGIEAVAGVTDGGGNRARGNGDPAQCVGVRCAP